MEPIIRKETLSFRMEDEIELREREESGNRPPPTQPHLEVPVEQGPPLAKLLRVVGSLLLLGAAAAFMLQTWPNMSFPFRYLTFLGFTALLAGAGVYCGVRLKEDKGARSFLGIAAAFLPAHFIQLGAILYHGMYGAPKGLSPFFVLSMPTIGQAFLLMGLALPILGSVAFFAFSALIRTEAKTATLVYLIANAALLIPTRDPSQIGWLSLAIFGMLAYYNVTKLAGRALMTSKEGVISRAILAAPYVTLLTRSAMLYEHSGWLDTTMGIATTAIAFFVSRSLIASEDGLAKSAQWVAERVAFTSAAITWAVFATRCVLEQGAPFAVPFVYLPISMIFFGMSFMVKSDGRGYRRLAAWLAVATVLVQMITEQGILSSALCLATSVILTASAHEMKDKGMFLAGASGLVYGVLYHIKFAARFYSFSPWLSLAVIGTAVLLASSYFERSLPRFRETTRRMREELAAWK